MPHSFSVAELTGTQRSGSLSHDDASQPPLLLDAPVLDEPAVAVWLDDMLVVAPVALAPPPPSGFTLVGGGDGVHPRRTAMIMNNPLLRAFDPVQLIGPALLRFYIALKVRSNLESALRTFAAQREKERQDLKDALGTTDTNENLVKSLTALAKLAKSWVQRDDEISKVQGPAGRCAPHARYRDRGGERRQVAARRRHWR